MSTATNTIEELANKEYKYGFVTDIEADAAPRGLNEDIVRLISMKKNEPEWLLEWRLKAYRHWLTMKEPQWPNVTYPPIDYQDTIYYSAPKQKARPKSLAEVDPELLKTYEKLGISLAEHVITSYSIHYTKLYETCAAALVMTRSYTPCWLRRKR